MNTLLPTTGESSELNQDYLLTIRDQCGLQFETVLDFVKLPYWKPQGRKVRNRENVGHKWESINVVENSDPYKILFQWLWDSGVRKIFTVKVNDDGPDSHTNAAIRECLRGQEIEKTGFPRNFEIEIWKWKKFDLCSETIFQAAPLVKDVYLYSSGNVAVLRGWACKTGIRKLVNVRN